MDKNKILSEIESRMKRLESEYKALAEAHSLIAKTYLKPAVKTINLSSLVKMAEKSANSLIKESTKAAIQKNQARGNDLPKRKRSSNGFSKKVMEFFKASGKFQTTAAIANKFRSAYPEKNEMELNRYLAVILSQLKSKKMLVSYSPENKGQTGRLLMWGLPEWLNNNKPKTPNAKK
jgi:flagellar hook-basal body complex protein FliE